MRNISILKIYINIETLFNYRISGVLQNSLRFLFTNTMLEFEIILQPQCNFQSVKKVYYAYIHNTELYKIYNKRNRNISTISRENS